MAAWPSSLMMLCCYVLATMSTLLSGRPQLSVVCSIGRVRVKLQRRYLRFGGELTEAYLIRCRIWGWELRVLHALSCGSKQFIH